MVDTVSTLPLIEQWDLLETLHPAGLRGSFVLLKGYIDESVSKGQKVFTLSALVGRGAEDWKPLAEEWESMLRDVNESLQASRRTPISRYHAADCSNRKGEFRDWSEDEQRALTASMLNIFAKRALKTVSYSVDLEALKEAIPAGKELIGSAYSITTLFLFLGLGEWLGSKDLNQNRALRLSLVHDRCDWDAEILERFKSLVESDRFVHGRYFTTIVPLRWQDCTPLQAADLMAYENMKDAERRFGSRRTRYTFQQICENETTGVLNWLIGRDTLESLKDSLTDFNLPGEGKIHGPIKGKHIQRLKQAAHIMREG